MEVHHHPKVEKKRFKEYFLEFLMIFLAVTMGFIAENIRETITEKRIAGELAESLYKEVYTDSVIINQCIQNRLRKEEKEIDRFIDYVNDSSLITVSESFYRTFEFTFLNGYIFEPQDGILSQLRNSGMLRYFKSSKLQEQIGKLSVATEWVRTRNATERDVSQSTLRPFLIKHFDFNWIEGYIQHNGFIAHEGGLTEEEQEVEEKRALIRPVIVNIGQFNKREASNIAGYYLIVIRGTRRFSYKQYADINHQLLETLRKEYHVKNE